MIAFLGVMINSCPKVLKIPASTTIAATPSGVFAARLPIDICQLLRAPEIVEAL